MTPEQQIAAIAKLEARVEGIEDWLKSIDAKQDELIAIANRGKGALRMILMAGGVAGGLATALSWAWQHIRIGS